MREKSGYWPGKALPRIVCAAIMMDDEVIVGPRHMDKTMRELIGMRSERSDIRWWQEAIQGFVDQFGDFYTRTEAWKVAEAAGQIFRRCGGDTTDGGTLYSENLY